MGIGADWQNEVSAALAGAGVIVERIGDKKYSMLLCNEKLIVNLLALGNAHQPAELIELQTSYQLQGIYLLQLWEDVWQTRSAQVLGRIRSILGLNKRLHARKASIIAINQQQADVFLNAGHLQGPAKARYKYALTIEGQMVAVACFSHTRLMKRISAGYRSAELVRFATLTGYTVSGGFSKLLKYFIRSVKPNDIMSYADRDWSLGNAYAQSGFQLIAATPPAQIWLDKKNMTRYFPHRLPANVIPGPDPNYVRVYNTGNLKYILYL